MDQTSLFDLAPERHIWKVSELTERIGDLLEGAFRDVWIEGEVSNYHAAQSGHLYFTLKDARSQIRCVCFRDQVRGLKFRPEDGLHITVRGSLGVYEPRGEYQVYVSHIEPVGLGALQLAFEQLKKKLQDEGLFDEARKKPLPVLPRCIGVVTSPTGAAIRDILRVLKRRFANVHVQLYPVKVQGEAAAAEIVAALRYFNRAKIADVLIVARGGGSLEDLWSFNEEIVARAIAACEVPVITGIGHETDFTIADFVADLRAPTPSAAAELVIRSRVEIESQAEAVRERLVRAMERRLLEARNALMERAQDGAFARMMDLIRQRQQKVDDLTYRLERGERQKLELTRRRWETLAAAVRHYDLRRVLAGIRGELEAGTAAMAAAMRNQLLQKKVRMERMGRALETLSPLAILERGYALVFDGAGELVKDAALVKPGDEIRARVARGEIAAVVKKSGARQTRSRQKE